MAGRFGGIVGEATLDDIDSFFSLKPNDKTPSSYVSAERIGPPRGRAVDEQGRVIDNKRALQNSKRLTTQPSYKV